MKMSGGKIFVAIALLIIGFAFYDYQKSAGQESDKLVANRVFPNRSIEDVFSFKIHSIFGDVVIEAKNEKWRMVLPVQDSADTQAVTTYLGSLLNQEMKKVEIETESDINWSQYGLDRPDGWVEITFRDKGHVLIQVGTVRAIADGHYLREDSGKSLFVGAADWTNLVNRPPAEFRDKSMFEIEPDQMTEIALQQKDTLSLVKKDNVWKLSGPGLSQDHEVDQTKINDFAIVLSNFKVDLVGADSKTDLQTFGLQKPYFDVRVKALNDECHVSFSNGKSGKVYVLSSIRDGVFEVSPDKVKSLMKTAQDFDKEKKPDLNKPKPPTKETQ